MASQSASSLKLDCDFECGNAVDFRQEGDTVFFRIRPDTESTDRQWFAFRLRGGAGRSLTFCLEGTNEVNIPQHWDFARPVVSADGLAWVRVDGDTRHDGEAGRFYFLHTPSGEETYFAFHYPYGYSRNVEQIRKWKSHPAVSVSVIGSSVQGRPIDMLRVSETMEDDGKLGVWVTCRQHAAETNASYFLDGFMDWLLSNAEDAREFRANAVVNVVPMINPDGVIAGNYRDNIKGVNLNRVWDAPDLENSPEILAVTKAIRQWTDDEKRFDFYIDLHGDAECLAHYAFHAADCIKPPKYSEPDRYHADTMRYLSMVNERNPDFTMDEGASTTDELGLSRQHITFTYGVMAILFEGGYSYVNYGPRKGEWLTPDRHAAVGRAAGEALARFLSL